MSFYSSGNKIVDMVGKLNLIGDVVPHSWREKLVTKSGKPYYLAIHILADIVYWYRPTEVREEETGRLIGWKKKFDYDFYQRNYESYEDTFKEGEKTIRRAFDYLEEKGLIKRHKGTITLANGDKLFNRMFIELIPKKLEEITYPIVTMEKLQKQARTVVYQKSQDKADSKNGQKRKGKRTEKSIARDKKVHPQGQICPTEGSKMSNERVKNVHGARQKCPSDGTDLGIQKVTNVRTNTNNTTENTTEISTENTTESTTGKVSVNNNPSIHQSAKKIDTIDRNKLRAIIRENIDYENEIQAQGMLEQGIFDDLYQAICDIVCYPRASVRIGGVDMPYEDVRERFMSLTGEHLNYAIYCISKTTTRIHDIRGYLLTTLYRAPETIETYYQTLAQADMYGRPEDD